MPNKQHPTRHTPPPFELDALRPYVSVTLHAIEGDGATSEELAAELTGKLIGLFEAFDIDSFNPFKISERPEDRAILRPRTDDHGMSLTGIWFKRVTAPPWLDADKGSSNVTDVTNHILLLAVRKPYLAVLGTHDRTRSLLSKDLAQGKCGERQLSFFAPAVSEEALERAFIRGQTKTSWLAALHAQTATKPDSKILVGQDLRSVFEPFSDQTFILTGTVSHLPALRRSRALRYEFQDVRMADERKSYAFRVGVTPEKRRVWTLPTKEFRHFLEELHVLFDTLDLPPNPSIIGPWAHDQDGFKFLGRPVSSNELGGVAGAFDVSLDLPVPSEPDRELSETEQYRELWRAYGTLEVISASPSSGVPAEFTAGVSYGGERVLELGIRPHRAPDGTIELQQRSPTIPAGIAIWHDGVTCFETLLELDRDVTMTVRYDSGHVIRGKRLFRLGWQDVLFESWRWAFQPSIGPRLFSAALEKPEPPTLPQKAGKRMASALPRRKNAQGWETTLGTRTVAPGASLSLFDFVVEQAASLFQPQHDWHLCCDDGPGEVADFVYFEPGAGRLYLLHAKGAGSARKSRELSVKVYEEVVSQATKNLRYLDPENLRPLLSSGRSYPIAQCSFHNGGLTGSRDAILQALAAHGQRRLADKRVIVFQPHVRQTVWDGASRDWLTGKKPTPKNQINRFLQLRTLLADAELTCRRIGARFEVWGET